jgi:uncharacterized protein YndB with AHSA1/START domain
MAINISTIKVNAPLQKVWDAITKPEFVKLWQYDSDLLTSWEIGSDIRFKAVWGDKVFEQWGKVLVFEPPGLVKYSLFAPAPGLEDKPGNYFIMQYVLQNEGGQTQLQIIQEDNRPNAVQEEPQGEENPILKALKDLAEGKT